jgi:fatty-acyl-CoA synthase
MNDWYTKKSFPLLLSEAAERWGHREALFHEGKRWSFVELETEIDAVAKGFIALGIQPGDHVALWMPNRPEWIFAFFALCKIGAVTIPINTRFRSVDLEYVARQSDTSTLIIVDRFGSIDYLALTREAVPEIEVSQGSELHSGRFPALRRVIVLGDQVPSGAFGWGDMLRLGKDVPLTEVERRHRGADPDAIALMLYTSGTTGFPKGVMHSQNIQRNVVDIANRLGYRSDDVMLMNWPLFHVVGLYLGPLLNVIAGVKTVLTTTFDPAESLRLIPQERVTRVWGFDTQLGALINHPDLATTDLSSMRAGVGAVGMVSSEAVARRAQEVLWPTVSGWGMTEVGAGVTLGVPDGPVEDRWTTSGYPLPSLEFKVIDPETGLVVPHGDLGELCARGYSVTKGYYKKPEETASAIDSDGWLHTGDVATMREDGVIRLLGRYKDILKVGGENVDPAEVEGFLLTHPAVAQVQVVGASDPRLSEVVCACVVRKVGHSVTNADLASHCHGKLASFKIPRYTMVLDEFPMTPSGKTQKFKLREMVAEFVANGGGMTHIIAGRPVPD